MEVKDATVIINGITISAGAAMALRAAVSAMYAETGDPDMLGDDEHGRAMVQAYRVQCALILRLLGGGKE